MMNEASTIARPLPLLVTLINKDLDQANKAGKPYYMAAGNKLIEACKKQELEGKGAEPHHKITGTLFNESPPPLIPLDGISLSPTDAVFSFPSGVRNLLWLSRLFFRGISQGRFTAWLVLICHDVWNAPVRSNRDSR